MNRKPFLFLVRCALWCGCLVLCVWLCPISANAISAQAYVTMEASTGRVLAAYRADEPRPIASTTKIMTALLTLEAGDPDQSFTVDPNAILVEGSSMGLQTGDRVTLRTLAQGMLLASGNDAANAAAVRICGNIPDFAKRMNERARQLGMEHTNFVTPSGLDAEGHVSTAYDMALLARAAIANPDFLSICSETSMKLSYGNPPYDRWLQNHNKLLKEYEGCIGVKTGFTKKAGRCLVSAAERDGVTVICVTLNAPDDWSDHKILLDEAFAALSLTTLPTDEAEGLTVPVVGAQEEKTDVVILNKATAPLMGNDLYALETELSLPPFCYAPIAAGDLLGKMDYYLTVDGTRICVGSVDLVAAADVQAVTKYKKDTFWRRLLGRLRTIF